ncbi:hypothetical protein [Polaromonas sp. SM01]|uniref:hypothetical protein n=1 Tax=Polaromonas sp. SM01 TaxID=3085630 RepID=UPI0029811011|nr:hypothetical protein [Polaromonas sp. SM01]
MTPFTTFLGRLAQRTRLQPGIAVALAGLFLLALLPREVSAQAQTFNYTGAVQTYTVPAGAAGVIIQANGAGGGSGGNDANGWGGAGGDGARATGTYLAAPGTVLNIYVGQGGQSGKTSDGNPYTRATSVGAGGLAGGTTGYAGGVGGTPGGSGWSGGGAGGGAASVVATSGNTRVLIAGGGGGGQGGALDVMGRAGLDASATGAMPGAAGQAGTGRANGEDGAGGGGGGAGCPRGTGGGAVADSSGTNTSTQATGGGSCNTAAVTGFSVTGGAGGAGGPSVTGVAPASGNPGSNGSVIITPIIPALSLTKSQPSPALQTAVNSVYTLTVTNSGTGPASAARVLDQLPANLSYVSGIGTNWSCSAAGGLVTCNFVGTIAAGVGSSTIAITVTPTNTTTAITNYAAVGSNGTTTVPTPTTCTAANTPTAGCAAPVTNSVVLGLVKSAPSPALQVSNNSAYTLTVTNSGTATATTARVVDQLPANMTYVSGTGTGSGWSCSAAGGLVTCNFVGTITAGGGTSVLTITATPTSTASVINRAAVDPTGGTTPPTASTCTATNTPSAGCAAPVTNTPTSVILGLVKSVPSPALQVGNNSAYTLTVTNSGTAGTTTARVVDQLPANMTYVSGTGTGWTCTPSGSTLVTCDYSGSIAAGGGTAAITITATPTSTAQVINRAAVDPTGGATPPTASTCTAANTPSAGCAAPITSTPTSVILGLVKSTPSPALQVGSNSAYTLTVTNTGTATTTTARVVDQLPANLTYVSGAGTNWSCSVAAGLVTCNYSGPAIAASGGTAAVVITVTPTSTAQVINRAAVDPTGGTTPPTASTCTAANTPSAGCAAPVTSTPTSVILGLVKSTPSPALQVGNSSAYTLTVTNTGTAASTTARITDQLPANLSYVSGVGAGWTCSVVGSLVTCNYSGTIAASGGAAAVVITATPTSTASATNYASVDPTGGTATPTPTSCTAANAPAAGCAAPVTNTPTSVILGLVKSAPSPALQVGSNSAYTLTVTNTGTAATTTARVVDQLPANLTYVSGAGTNWSCSVAAGLVTCDYSGPAITAGGGTSTITITATPTSTASVINRAAVDPTGGATPPTASTCTAANTPSAGCAAPVTNTPTSVILGLVKSMPSPALKVGSNSAYTLTVTNTGTAATTTARITDQLPANMTYVSGVGTGWTCTPSGSTLVTCNYSGSIAAGGGTSVLTITATPTSVASVTNFASVDPTGGTVSPTPTTCTAANAPSTGCAAPVISTPTSVILGLLKSAPSPALQVGSNSAYTLTVTNTGTAATTTARVVDQLPANMSYVSGTGTGWTCTPTGSTLVTCDYIGSIAAGGGTVAVVITATPTSTASVSNRAAVDPTGGTTPPTASTCTATNTPSAGCAAPVTNTPTSVILSLVKSAPSPALKVGSNSAYTLTVTNTGTAAATTARVLDQLPANMTYVSGTGSGWSCSVAAGLVTCNFVGTIPAGGGTSVLTITATPTSTASVTNYAAVDPTGGTVPPTPTTCTAANAPTAGCAAPVISAPTNVILGLVKSVPSPALQVGSNSAYTLTVTNTGTAATTTARVVDQLPANMTFVSATGTGWTCSTSGSTLVTCNYSGSIAAGGGTAAITITATPTSTASVTNYAAVDPTGGTVPPTPTTCTAANAPSAGCATPVTSTPTSVILGLVKSAPSPALQVFSNSAYTLTVTNTGTAATTTARVVDQLPVNLTYVSGVGTGWSCTTAANAGGTLVTCNYSGSIAGGGGNAALVITVTPTSSAPVTNYASVDPTGGTTPPVPTTCTAANLPSAGCAAPVSTTAGRLVAGNVYSDANHNGSLDAGEVGIGGQIYVKLATFSGGVCVNPATDFAPVDVSTGAYSLPSVAQGSYCLIVDGNNTLSDITAGYPAGWLGTQNPTGVIQLMVGAAPPAPQNFGLYNGSKVSGTVFADNGAGGGTANNGIKAGSEAGMVGVTVHALQGVTAVASASSASDGSYILWVPATISGTVVITPALPSGYIATGGSAGSTGGSYTRPSVSYTAAAGQSPSGVNFGLVPPNTLAPNGAQTTQPGTIVFYAHTYSAGTGGQVSFTLANAATPASPVWNQVLYQDSNCSATLESSEPPVTAAVTVTAGQTICLIVKQFVPAGAGQGAQNSVTLSAAFTYTNANPALAVNTLSATDITTVGQAGDLSLAKLVSNVTQALPAATSVNAKPGDTLEYKLTATNSGTQALSTLFVNDSTAAFTGFVSAACPLPASLPAGITACAVTTQPAVGAQGALKWTFTGSLAPSAQLSVTYQVKVDQ